MVARSRVYVVSAEGGGPLLLVGEDERDGADATDPTWSPDGTRIAYGAARTGEIGEIRVLELARQKSAKIPGSDGMWSPRWSPNGKYLVTIKGYFPRKEYLFSFESQEWRELSFQHAARES
jgi:Tol biopolymer transport system component